LTNKQTNDRVVEYATKIGLPIALVGIGIGLFFGPYFRWGVALFYSGMLLLILHIAKQPFVRHQSRRNKIFLRLFCAASLVLFSIWLFRTPTIELQAYSTVPEYGSNSVINGIHWQRDYSEFRLTVRNASKEDYDNLDIEITTDLTFEDLRQENGLATCTIAPNGETFGATSQRMTGGVPVGPADTSGENYKAIAVDRNGQVISISGGTNRTYRIRCEKFPAQNQNTFIGALSVVNPFSNGKPPVQLYAPPRAANRFSAKISFPTLGRPRSAIL